MKSTYLHTIAGKDAEIRTLQAALRDQRQALERDLSEQISRFEVQERERAQLDRENASERKRRRAAQEAAQTLADTARDLTRLNTLYVQAQRRQEHKLNALVRQVSQFPSTVPLEKFESVSAALLEAQGQVSGLRDRVEELEGEAGMGEPCDEPAISSDEERGGELAETRGT